MDSNFELNKLNTDRTIIYFSTIEKEGSYIYKENDIYFSNLINSIIASKPDVIILYYFDNLENKDKIKEEINRTIKYLIDSKLLDDDVLLIEEKTSKNLNSKKNPVTVNKKYFVNEFSRILDKYQNNKYFIVLHNVSDNDNVIEAYKELHSLKQDVYIITKPFRVNFILPKYKKLREDKLTNDEYYKDYDVAYNNYLLYSQDLSNISKVDYKGKEINLGKDESIANAIDKDRMKKSINELLNSYNFSALKALTSVLDINIRGFNKDIDALSDLVNLKFKSKAIQQSSIGINFEQLTKHLSKNRKEDFKKVYFYLIYLEYLAKIKNLNEFFRCISPIYVTFMSVFIEDNNICSIAELKIQKSSTFTKTVSNPHLTSSDLFGKLKQKNYYGEQKEMYELFKDISMLERFRNLSAHELIEGITDELIVNSTKPNSPSRIIISSNKWKNKENGLTSSDILSMFYKIFFKLFKVKRSDILKLKDIVNNIKEKYELEK